MVARALALATDSVGRRFIIKFWLASIYEIYLGLTTFLESFKSIPVIDARWRAKMSGWIGALMAATESLPGLRKPSTCLAAVALDDAGLAVEDLLAGTSILVATCACLRDAIETLLLVVLGASRQFAVCDAELANPVVVVRDGKRQPGWRQSASDTGRPAVVIVGSVEDVHPAQAVVTADRQVAVQSTYLPGSLEAAITMVTGLHVELDDCWPRVTFEDAVACIQRGASPVECASRLWKLVRSAENQARDDADDALGHRDTPAPLGRVASGVVKRLSEMSGFGDAGTWGMQLAGDLRAYGQGQIAWSEVDRGVLLSGPPGSGKSTFAKSLALEAGVELVASGYGDLANGPPSDISKLMAKKFDLWREKASKAPFIVLLDEIDTLGVRGQNAHNDSYWGGVINAMLAFLDGAVPRNGIVVIAATNHPERVDPALLRPGRLDRRIELPYPDASAMAAIVRHHLGPDAVIEAEELARAGRACRGMSPADVEQVCREARRAARTMFKRRVCPDDVSLVLGARRLEALQQPGARDLDRRIAIHEAGHAIAMLAAPSETLLSIDMDSAQTWAVGHMSLTLAEAEAQLTVLLSGMAAEQVLIGHHASGVSRDLKDATALAMTCHARWGMGVLGLRSAADEDLRDPTVLAATDAILVAAHARARALVEDSREAVLRLAGRLQADRYLVAAEVRAVVAGEDPEPTKATWSVGRRGHYPDPAP